MSSFVKGKWTTRCTQLEVQLRNRGPWLPICFISCLPEERAEIVAGTVSDGWWDDGRKLNKVHRARMVEIAEQTTYRKTVLE